MHSIDAEDQIVFDEKIRWPDGIDESVFLQDFWQQKPLLIRQAFPDFQTPLPADELAGLSLEPDTGGRIITQDASGNYHLEHGPFDEQRFAELGERNWSLLVTDVEKHLPEFIAYLQPFRFIPDWRIDDLMISYAPNGASVGAHVDEYDVFLFQASGTRTWHIDSRADTVHDIKTTGDLKILANFSSTDTWDLQTGDMLYLPPNMAHHGIANGDDCMTWSVGFRAPLVNNMLSSMAELISDELSQQRYTDGVLSPAKHGEISAASVARFKALWEQSMQLTDEQFAQLLGRFLTEANQIAPDSHKQTTASAHHSMELSDTVFCKSSFSQFAWHERTATQASLFVDGQLYASSKTFAQQLCAAPRQFVVQASDVTANDAKVLDALVTSGSLIQG